MIQFKVVKFAPWINISWAERKALPRLHAETKSASLRKKHIMFTCTDYNRFLLFVSLYCHNHLVQACCRRIAQQRSLHSPSWHVWIVRPTKHRRNKKTKTQSDKSGKKQSNKQRNEQRNKQRNTETHKRRNNETNNDQRRKRTRRRKQHERRGNKRKGDWEDQKWLGNKGRVGWSNENIPNQWSSITVYQSFNPKP